MKSKERVAWIWVFVIIAGLWSVSALTSCNTAEGVGEDVEDLGEGIEDAAD